MPDGLLLLHAFPLDASMWEPQALAFSGEIPVAAPDFPGFGSSGTRRQKQASRPWTRPA
jgi:pimeloyl-ACP methyl ester carboxylesterase